MVNIAIFASGSGTNAENLVKYFSAKSSVKVVLIAANSSKAYVLERAKKMNIPSMIFNKEDLCNNNKVLNTLFDLKVDYIILAGFLWLMPKTIIDRYPNRIINIHPALLPKYGGKGMYGMNVHHAVVENKEKESGITIHFVNEHYDSGDIIFQATCEIEENDTPEILAQKIHALEYEYFPIVVDKIIGE